MKNRLTIFEWAIVAIAVLSLIGSLSWYFMVGTVKIEESQSKLSEHTQEIGALVDRRYIPSSKNIGVLKANLELVSSSLDLVSARLAPKESPIVGLNEMESIDFKQLLLDKVKGLNDAAKEQSVEIPANFFFGFGRYKDTNPPKTVTVLLQKQLYAIDALVKLLIDAKVAKIERVCRSHDEDGPVTPSSAGRLGVDQVKDSMYIDPHKIYNSYPFEVEFVSDTEPFKKFVNEVVKMKVPMIIRTCEVTSKRLISPRKDKLDAPATPLPTTKTPAGKTVAVSLGAEPPRIVLGDELIGVTIRLDMIEWMGEVKEIKDAKKPKGEASEN